MTKQVLIRRPDFRTLAIARHGDQRYGDFPYAYHLSAVEAVLEEYGFDSYEDRVFAWWHDSIEDVDVRKEEIEDLFGTDPAALVWACTGVGANRKERNAAIKEKILALPRAAPRKLADRLANLRQARKEAQRLAILQGTTAKDTRHIIMYRKELEHFEYIQPFVPEKMWEELLHILS